MRIVGGKYKGRTLNFFDGNKIRPTSDMARESLFNILQTRIYGAKFLDLFSGTGAMGIEALSRGADSVTFNDFSRDSIALIKKNLSKLSVTEKYQIKNLDALTLLDGIGEKFDIVYIDPPYKTDLGVRALSKVTSVCHSDTLIIFEDEKPLDTAVDGLIVTDRRKYGRVHLTILKKED
ncbi:MAG: 16S rRNA (guanine(966)-N(2))-methyltransferase RsmD [Clostridia bacterium]|nr:16S rRNA (guanine(966)-N(2))-methyltransferase RsmD [Clostridia bacterium]